MVCCECLARFVRQAISGQRVDTIVALAFVVDDKYCIFEFLSGLKDALQDINGKALAHARVYVESDLVGVHKALAFVLHGAK